MKPQRVIRLLLIVTLLSIAPLLAQARPGPRATTVYPLVLEALRPKGAKGAEGAQGLQNAGDRTPVLLVMRQQALFVMGPGSVGPAARLHLKQSQVQP